MGGRGHAPTTGHRGHRRAMHLRPAVARGHASDVLHPADSQKIHGQFRNSGKYLIRRKRNASCLHRPRDRRPDDDGNFRRFGDVHSAQPARAAGAGVALRKMFALFASTPPFFGLKSDAEKTRESALRVESGMDIAEYRLQ